MIRETRLRVASNHTHGWQANEKTHLCVASGIRAMPEKEKPPAMRVDDYLLFFRKLCSYEIKNALQEAHCGELEDVAKHFYKVKG